MKSTISVPKRVTIQYLKWILPILLVVFACLSAVIYWFDSATQSRINRDFSQKILEQADQTLTTWLDDQTVVLSMIATDPRVIAACANPMDNAAVAEADLFLASFHAQNRFYENIALSADLPPGQSFVITAVNGSTHTISRGRFFVDSSHGDSVGKSSPEHPMAKAIYSEHKPNIITHVYRSLIYGHPAFIMSLPVYKDGHFVGAVHMAMPMSNFTDKFVNNVKVGQTGYMFMVDDRGLLIAHPNQDFILNEEVAATYNSVVTPILQGNQHFEQLVDGTHKTYNVLKFNFKGRNHISDWYLVFVQSQQEILASSVSFIWLISAFLIVAFLLVIAVVYMSTKKLLYIGFHDRLTNLYNRNYLEHEKFWLATGRCNPVGFVVIDVDGLKLVNDTCGHNAGDHLLTTVALLIKQCFFDNAVVMRLGGDEFAVLIPFADIATVQGACDDLEQDVQTYNRRTSDVPVSLSIGYAVKSLHGGTSFHDLMEEADLMMYMKKDVNRISYVRQFDEWLDQEGPRQ